MDNIHARSRTDVNADSAGKFGRTAAEIITERADSSRPNMGLTSWRGAKVIDRLAADLQREFPKLAGYSARNLKYMRALAEAWPDRGIVHQLGAQIPWKHNCVLLDRVKDAATREFYIRKTVEHGWSRSVLIHQLDTELHKRLGKAPTNFALACSPTQSDLARETLEPMSEQIIALKRQTQNLRRTRDLLLPRLLSGQVEWDTSA